MKLEDITLNISPTFNTVEELREYLEAQGHEETTFFQNPSFVKAIIGISDSEQLIYDYDLMILAAMEEQDWDYESAVEWIDHNIFREISYMGSCHPIVSLPINW
jgi:hypothetical protein